MRNDTPITVIELPERLTLTQVEAFLPGIIAPMSVDRPRCVFNFSGFREIDSAGVNMLLYCLEEVTKRDGDLKLAAVHEAAAVVLELTCIDRLFEIFETSADAVASFDGLHIQSIPGRFVPIHSNPDGKVGAGADNLKLAS